MIVAGAATFSAFEAHVVNVTARIENALDVPIATTGLDFGTRFPQETPPDQPFSVSLSGSFQDQAQCDQTNLVANGGFETPVVLNGAQWDIYPGGIPNWSVDWADPSANTFNGSPRPATANIELHRGVAGWLSHSGSQHTELDSDWDGPGGPLNGEPALVIISQNVTTVIGKQYDLHYFFSARPNNGGGGNTSADNVLNILVNDAQVDTHTLSNGTSQTAWQEFVTTFTATGTTTKISFAGGGLNNSLGVFLDDVSVVGKCGGRSTVSYVIKQKPKCGVPTSQPGPEGQILYSDYVQVTEDAQDNFVCPLVLQPTGGSIQSVQLPLLCPYLSKHEVTTDGTGGENDGTGINAFHGLPGPWNLATTNAAATNTTGLLSVPVGDLTDTWNIDLKVPAFAGFEDQGWANFAHQFNPNADPSAYLLNPLDEHQTFGCDLWLEVTGIQ